MVSFGCLAIFLVVSLLPGSFAPFVVVGRGCRSGTERFELGQVWYKDGECSRYGCFNPEHLSTYKLTCPNYPIPDCRYKLISSPDSPFPYCCIRPVCV